MDLSSDDESFDNDGYNSGSYKDSGSEVESDTDTDDYVNYYESDDEYDKETKRRQNKKGVNTDRDSTVNLSRIQQNNSKLDFVMFSIRKENNL